MDISNAGILQEYPNWHTTSLSCFVKKHESEGPWWMQHVISFFSRECLISGFVLVFYPLVSSSSASAMSMAS